MFLWRISNHRTLDGKGRTGDIGPLAFARPADRVLGRERLWGTPGGACALGTHSGTTSQIYRLLKVKSPDDISMRARCIRSGKNWVNDETATRTLGDEWLASMSTALLRVPSAVAQRRSMYF